MGADNKGRDIKRNQVCALNRPVRTVQAIRMRIAQDAAVAYQRIRGRRGFGDEGEEGVDRDGGE